MLVDRTRTAKLCVDLFCYVTELTTEIWSRTARRLKPFVHCKIAAGVARVVELFDTITLANIHTQLYQRSHSLFADVPIRLTTVICYLDSHSTHIISTVGTAPNGLEAVEIVRTQPVDLVLMDMKMPVMDGRTATSEIRKFNAEIPIIALTAHAFDADRVAALKAGCDDYLVKPINGAKLMQTLKEYGC